MALALTTTGTRTQRVSTASSKQSSRLSSLSKGYKALGMSDKSTWIKLAQSLNTSSNRTGRHKLTAANLYTKVNSVRLSCQLPVLASAPQSLPSMSDLPDQISVEASNNGTFNCFIQCSLAYNTFVQIKAPPIAPAGYNTYALQSFRIIGVVPALSDGFTPIAEMYAAKYGAPPPGAEVVLELVAMDILGDKLSGRVVTGIVSAVGAEGSGPQDEMLQAA